MNILLSTYSFYPYHWGGSEVYVSGLSAYLKAQGNEIYIIAGMPPEAFTDHEMWYQDDNLKAVQYKYEGVNIIGVVLTGTGITEIYTKFKQGWISSWTNILQKLPVDAWQIYHTHAHTSLISIAIVKAVRQHSPAIKILASYHTPLSCMKNTLIRGNLFKECNVKPTKNICTACVLSSKTNLPVTFTQPIVLLMPAISSEGIPTALRLKFLISKHIQSFKNLNAEIDQWHVFSKQIKQILLLNDVISLKIKLLRHGANQVYFKKRFMQIQRQQEPISFLYMGRFEKLKGFHTLLKAWCSLTHSPQRKLLIIGDVQTPDTDIKKWIDIAAKRNDIIWYGKKSQEEIAEILQQVHCTIIPSEWVEIGPLVYHEAIQSGTDVIASDIGGCKELSQLYSLKSTLFKAGNSKQLKEAIAKFTFSNISASANAKIANYGSVYQSYQELCGVLKVSDFYE